MKHQTARVIISVFAGFFLLDTIVLIIKHRLKEMAEAFDIEWDFFEDLDIDEDNLL